MTAKQHFQHQVLGLGRAASLGAICFALLFLGRTIRAARIAGLGRAASFLTASCTARTGGCSAGAQSKCGDSKERHDGQTLDYFFHGSDVYSFLVEDETDHPSTLENPKSMFIPGNENKKPPTARNHGRLEN